MFDIFDWLISLQTQILIFLGWFALFCILASSHPYILMFVCTCFYPCILTFSYLQVVWSLEVTYMFDIFDWLISWHPHIFRFLCTCLYPRILTSPYPYICVYFLVSSHPSSDCLHPFILIFSDSCSDCHILKFMCACWYPRNLTFSYPQVYVWLLVCSHPHVNVYSIQMINCIFASSSSSVLGTCASQFVNNLQILRIGQAYISDHFPHKQENLLETAIESKFEKKFLLKSRQNL